MRRLLPILLVLTATPVFAWTGCGLTFDLPHRWTAAVIDRDAEQCEVGLRPVGWEAMVARSRWPEDEYAIRLTRYSRMTLKQAAAEVGFESDDQGRWGVPALRGMISPAERVRYGVFAGWRSDALERGYAKKGAELGDQSRVMSTTLVAIALADGHGTVVGFEYYQWSPDIKVDREKAAMQIARSLRAAKPPTARTR
jgi:hypothetical protein